MKRTENRKQPIIREDPVRVL